MNLMIVSGMCVCRSFLISVCMFIVLKALLISISRVIGSAGVPFGLTPLLRCHLMCVVPVLHGCVWYASCYVGKRLLSSVFVGF